MSTNINIHADTRKGYYGRDRGELFSPIKWDPTNNNSVSLRVGVDANINFFNLDAITAEGLYLWSVLSVDKRAAVIEALRHARDEQNAEAEGA